jgi:hypothetical protein
LKPVKTKVADVPTGSIHQYDAILKYFNDEPAQQNRRAHYRSITFVTTGIIAYDGGQTTMLHLGTLLSEQGYQVFYLSYVPQSAEDMATNAEFNYPNYQGKCLDMSHLDNHQSDIWVATLWESAYVIKSKPGYKMYFVQDYEPYFYPFGDRYQLAKRTYDLGLHIISLGPWCVKMIEDQCDPHGIIDQINFPIDLDHYPLKERDFNTYKDMATVKLAVYTKWTSPRRAPITIQLVLKNAEAILAKKGITLKIRYFGSPKSKHFINGKNLGKLTRPEMNALYHWADFGIAPSMTNFSLVPFEMMSTGLPFIDFLEGTGRYFLPDTGYIPTHMDEKALAQTILDTVRQPEGLPKMIHESNKYLHSVTWDRTINSFIKILDSLQLS